MQEYYFKQTYSVYKNYGIGLPTMGGKGCVITGLAMILSYINDSAYTPEKMLSWGRENGMIDRNGNTIFSKFCEATGNTFRMSTSDQEADVGETIYGIREVRLKSGLLHWVIDHPIIPHKIIDPWDGKVKGFTSVNPTGRVYFYIGKK